MPMLFPISRILPLLSLFFLIYFSLFLCSISGILPITRALFLFLSFLLSASILIFLGAFFLVLFYLPLFTIISFAFNFLFRLAFIFNSLLLLFFFAQGIDLFLYLSFFPYFLNDLFLLRLRLWRKCLFFFILF